jgi:hypothetical protein
MSEPAEDTAIEITPKPQASSVRVPRIVAEINRVASRVRDINKKEDDAEVLENDTPTPSPKPVDIQIIRENTHYRGKKRLNILLAFLLVLISVLLLAVCVFLARIDENIRSGGGTSIQSLASPPPPPYSPPPPTVITQESMEYKAIVWETNTHSALPRAEKVLRKLWKVKVFRKMKYLTVLMEFSILIMLKTHRGFVGLLLLLHQELVF